MWRFPQKQVKNSAKQLYVNDNLQNVSNFCIAQFCGNSKEWHANFLEGHHGPETNGVICLNEQQRLLMCYSHSALQKTQQINSIPIPALLVNDFFFSSPHLIVNL